LIGSRILLILFITLETSQLPATNAKEHWNEHVEIRELLDKIQRLQVVQAGDTHQRFDFLPKFSEWLKENGADSENVSGYPRDNKFLHVSCFLQIGFKCKVSTFSCW
jgi:hypothetical protein